MEDKIQHIVRMFFRDADKLTETLSEGQKFDCGSETTVIRDTVENQRFLANIIRAELCGF